MTREPAGHVPSGAFVVHAAKLQKVAGTTRREHRHGVIEDLATVGAAVPEGSEVDADLTLVSYPGGVSASGVVSAPWQGECRRCGGPVTGEVRVSVRERFARNGGEAADEDAYPLDGDELDLEPLARDAVLLELPLAPLCDEGCRGLCPECGANRNVESCTCGGPVDPRWSALDALRSEEGPGSA
jgi:uncharacterized protein